MFGRNKYEAPAAQPSGVDTVLGAGCRVRGDVSVQGAARVLGEIDGALKVDGELTIEMGGAVKGAVTSERARIAGRVEGDVRVQASVELCKGAYLRGDVYAKSFRIEDGAIFQGNSHMEREEAPGLAAGGLRTDPKAGRP